MEWLTNLHGQVIGLDTAPLIYYIEEHEKYLHLLEPFFFDLDQSRFRAVTSTVTLLEVLVQSLRHGDDALAHQYNDVLLSSPNISMFPVTYATAQEAAELRARHNLKTPDAIQLAVARSEGATTFLTNDRDFPTISGVTILRLRDIVA